MKPACEKHVAGLRAELDCCCVRLKVAAVVRVVLRRARRNIVMVVGMEY